MKRNTVLEIIAIAVLLIALAFGILVGLKLLKGADSNELTVHSADTGMPAFLGGLSDLEKQVEALGVETLTIKSGGRKRRFHFYVPPSAKRGRNASVLLVLHGGAGNALQFAHTVGAVQMANEHGFVIVAPQGYGALGWWFRRGGWNADSRTRLGSAETKQVDDISFLGDLIRFARFEAKVEPGRVFVMGISKGGMMAFRLACALPDEISAIAVVAGTMSTDLCPDGAPVRLVQIHGSADENVPLEGGHGRFSSNGADWPEVARGLDIFKQANGCTDAPIVSRIASDTICENFCRDGQDLVQFCLVEGGGHAWPGSQPSARQQARNVYVSPHFNASRHIARFFLGRR